jgi:hypothetical protein
MERNSVEAAAEMVAAASLGASVAFATTLLGAGVAGAFAGSVCFAATLGILRRLPFQGRWRLPDFPLADLAPEPREDVGGSPELLLTDADRLHPEHLAGAASAIAEELLLDDVLASPAPDSRVVRLFGEPPVPRPGELQARIERHLEQRGSEAAPADAAAALSEALAAVRRSLR